MDLFGPDQRTTPLRAERQTTDKGCLYTFIGFMVFLLLVLVYACARGSVAEYVGFQDASGNVCGLSPATANEEYLYLCQDGANGVYSDHPVCVSTCPESTSTYTECPTGMNGAMQSIRDYPSKPYSGKVCMPVDHVHEDLVKEALHLRHPAVRCFLVASNALEHYWALILAVAVTMALGFSHVLLLKHSGLCFVWVGFALMISVPLALGIWLVRTARAGDFNLAGYEQGSLAAGYVCIVLAVGISVLLACDWRDMRIAKITMQAAAECILDASGLIFWPFFALAARVSLIIGLFLGFLLLTSCNAPGILGVALGALYIFASLWALQVGNTLSLFVVAYVTEEWFFATLQTSSKEVENAVTCKAVSDGLRHNLGTMARGAFVMPVVRIPRMFFHYVYRAAEMDNAVGEYVRSSCRCCVDYYERRLECLNRSLWFEVALNSLPFRPAAVEAMEVMTDEATDVMSLHGAAWLIELGGAGGVTAICVVITHFICTHFWTFNDHTSPYYVANPAIIDLFVAFISCPIAFDFLLVVVHVSDCLLFCCAVERSRNPLRTIVDDVGDSVCSSCSSRRPQTTTTYDYSGDANHLPRTRELLTLVTRERQEMDENDEPENDQSGYCG